MAAMNVTDTQSTVLNQDGDSTYEKELPLLEAIRKYGRTVKFFLGLTTAILLFGYDNVLVGSVTAVGAFQNAYGELFDGKWIIPAHWLSAW
jgi:MFS transporter, SP family, general alpha glucoside:H+ symporter